MVIFLLGLASLVSGHVFVSFRFYFCFFFFCFFFRFNQGYVLRPRTHLDLLSIPQLGGGKYQNVWVGSKAANTKPLHGM